MTHALSISGLKKQYGNGFEALKGVDLTVEAGDFFALLGPNGAGKSTTIGIVCSLVNKTAGQVSIFGVDIDENFAEAKKHIGVVPQEFNFHVFERVIDIVLNQAGYFGIARSVALPRAEKYLKQLSLWDKRFNQARELSGGMKRRLMIARALIHQPKLLILDEPTAGVDIEIRRSMWEFLQQINAEGTTIILTTHYLEEAEQLCRNIAIIDGGKIVKNTSVKALLQTLDKETLVLDSIAVLPQQVELSGIQCRRLDDHSLEVDIHKGENLNALFRELAVAGIEVSSLRNKSNRLEELFISMTGEHAAVEGK
ncbi:ABC-2 type transport system ATP-binding protein [Sinobacterium caligoides]|uniref:ABC-2 type transport system ATP-binding protein n=1 Tax=Sinobacterium caligoides TaxID=933926 RepID=A0A3N2DYW4_9GAMM|nr:ABC transporter ATP-binding protein [Sinobacterium caligoides]ROS05018.1 ABC-2 type transport system ATP-binding protein [Sinobacterium caligoides]